jgi:choice-of-anchor B domain-containing protein
MVLPYLWLMRFLFIFLFLPFFTSAQLNLQQIGHLPYAPLSLAGCWHYVDSTGIEYALVGTSAGLSIVDLSNPTQPKERFMVPSLANNWREVKTWNGFAYFGSEAAGSGINIVDLRSLPDTIYSKVWFGHGFGVDTISRSHALQAEAGYLYVFGGGNITNGATIATLEDPWNPRVLSKYTDQYVHDGFIRGDTLWTSEIYKGWFGVVDISDRENPVLLTTHPTPGAFNHNSGLSADSKVLFTTDEKPNTPLASFDVTDIDNIKPLDIYFPSQQPYNEVHNVRVHGDFLVNPSYGGQLTIVDATRPDNLIETAWAIMGSSLVWDADPYLPSGIVFATAKNEGLFIYQANYQKAAWLEGKVYNAITNLAINGAKVLLLNTPNGDSTDISGTYKTGMHSTGTYTVEISKNGYLTQTVEIPLISGQLTLQDFYLVPTACDPAYPEVPLNGTDEDCDGLDELYLSLPPYIYAVEGVANTLYFRNYFLSKHPQDYQISVETDLDGLLFADKWVWSGTDSSGEYDFVLRLKNNQGTVLETAKTTFRIAQQAPPADKDSVSVILMGNSFFNQGWLPSYLQIITDTLTNQKITYHGTNSSWLPPFTPHEGYGGITAQWFFNSPVSPLVDDTLALNAQQLYDQIICPGCSPDWVLIQLDINEFCNFDLLKAQSIIETDNFIQGYWEAFLFPAIAHLKTISPKLKIGLCVAPPANENQDAFYQTFPNNPVLQEQYRWEKIVNRLMAKYRENFEVQDSLGIYVVPLSNNFEGTSQYNEIDAVHPLPDAYLVIAQNVYAWMRWVMQPKKPVIVDPPSKVKDLYGDIGLYLYPNPTAENRVSLLGAAVSEVERITIVDALGSIMTTQSFEKNRPYSPIEILVPQAFSGTYWLRAYTAKGIKVVRGVKTK